MNNSYYNTTHSQDKDLFDYEAKAVSQEDKILAWFRQPPHRNGAYSPSHVQESVLPHSPCTSVRRAITNLTRQGRLEKTGQQVRGPYKRPEYLWKLKHA